MLLLLANLETREVRVFQLQVVFLLEVLSHCALHCLTALQLQGKPGRSRTRRMHLLKTDTSKTQALLTLAEKRGNTGRLSLKKIKSRTEVSSEIKTGIL